MMTCGVFCRNRQGVQCEIIPKNGERVKSSFQWLVNGGCAAFGFWTGLTGFSGFTRLLKNPVNPANPVNPVLNLVNGEQEG